MMRRFEQVDVFGDQPYAGNPLAVVVDGKDLTDQQMADFARWTNLSETTFLLPPTEEGCDYRVRIWTTSRELPFAGHPTLGSCHAWLRSRLGPAPERVVQQCGAGHVEIRQIDGRLAFAAPPLVHGGPADPKVVEAAIKGLGLRPEQVVDAAWVDNGPGWLGLLLSSSDDVLGISSPHLSDEPNVVGVIGPHPPGGPADYEVRAFLGRGFTVAEDPVTGSLNASLAQWLSSSGRATLPYLARQGTAIGRRGLVSLSQQDGEIWVSGETFTCVSGEVQI